MQSRWRAVLAALAACGLSAAPLEAGKKHALLIGISDYEHVRTGVAPLQWADNDAKLLHDLLAKEYKVTGPLVDRGARREHITLALARLRDEVGPDDSFLLFFAGHGVRDPSNDKTYWLTFDASPANLDDKGIRLDHLFDFVRDLRAKHKLILLDHCYSGDIKLDQAAAGEGPRDSAVRNLVSVEPPDAAHADALAPVVKQEAAGIAVLAASRTLAFESANFEHGVFTAGLRGALGTRRADTSGDGNLSVTELLAFMETEVPALAKSLNQEQKAIGMIKAEGITDWGVVRLPPGEPEAQRQADEWKQRLITFKSDGLSLDSYLEASDALRAWVKSIAAEKPLDPYSQKIVDEVREHMNAKGHSDKTLAGALDDAIKHRKATKAPPP